MVADAVATAKDVAVAAVTAVVDAVASVRDTSE
jgi:hypothetical protein